MQSHFKSSIPLDWIVDDIEIDGLPVGLSYGGVDIFEDRVGRRLRLPIVAIVGDQPGPVLGITAAVHGNEINGLPTIHQLINSLDSEALRGTLIAVPIVNLPGYLAYSREFIDGVDLNRIMPGKEKGSPSEIYAHLFTTKVLTKFSHHLDLHTASFGRINSHYIRGNLDIPEVREMAMLQHADIIVHATGPANSVRQTAIENNIPSLTIELGNPQIFQQHIVENANKSILNVLKHLDMIDGRIEIPVTEPVICKKSYWTRIQDGGILKVHPKLTQIIEKDELIATLYDVYGRKDLEYHSPESGIVVGKSVNPVASTGDRILHLGVLAE